MNPLSSSMPVPPGFGAPHSTVESARALRICMDLTFACHEMYDFEPGTKNMREDPIAYLQEHIKKRANIYPANSRLLVSDFSLFTNPAPDTAPQHPFLLLVCELQRQVFIGFRPTVSNTSTADVLADISGWANSKDYAGNRHAGFVARAESIPPAAFITWLERGYSVFVTGHSLGGAVAQLFATLIIKALVNNGAAVGEFSDRLACITFGTPQIADQSFWMEVKEWANVFHTYIYRMDGIFRLAMLSSDTIGKLLKAGIATALKGVNFLLNPLANWQQRASSADPLSSDLGQDFREALVPHYVLFGAIHFLPYDPEDSVTSLGMNPAELNRLLGVDSASSGTTKPNYVTWDFLLEKKVLGGKERARIFHIRDFQDHGCYPPRINSLANRQASIGQFESGVPELLNFSDVWKDWGLPTSSVILRSQFYSLTFAGPLADFVLSVKVPKALQLDPEPTPPASPHSSVKSSSVSSSPSSIILGSKRPTLRPTRTGVRGSNNNPKRAESVAEYAVSLLRSVKTREYFKTLNKSMHTIPVTFITCLGKAELQVPFRWHPLTDEEQDEPIDILFVCYWEMLLTAEPRPSLAQPMDRLLKAVDAFGDVGPDEVASAFDSLFAEYFAKRQASKVHDAPHEYFEEFLRKLPINSEQLVDLLHEELSLLHHIPEHASKPSSKLSSSMQSLSLTTTASSPLFGGTSSDTFTDLHEKKQKQIRQQASELHEYLCTAITVLSSAGFDSVLSKLTEKDSTLPPQQQSGIHKIEDESKLSTLERIFASGSSLLSFRSVATHLNTFRNSVLPQDIRSSLANSIVPLYAMAIKFTRLQGQVKIWTSKPPYSHVIGTAQPQMQPQMKDTSNHAPVSVVGATVGQSAVRPLSSLSRLVQSVLSMIPKTRQSASRETSQEAQLYAFLRVYGQNALQVAATVVLASLKQFTPGQPLSDGVGDAWHFIEIIHSNKNFRSATFMSQLLTDELWKKTFVAEPLANGPQSSLTHRPFWIAAIDAMVALHELRLVYMTSPDKIVICGPQKSGKTPLFKELTQQQRTFKDLDGKPNTRIPLQVAAVLSTTKGDHLHVHLIDTPAYDDITGLEDRMWHFSALAATGVLVITTMSNVNAEGTVHLLSKMLECCAGPVYVLVNKVDQTITEAENDELKLQLENSNGSKSFKERRAARKQGQLAQSTPENTASSSVKATPFDPLQFLTKCLEPREREIREALKSQNLSHHLDRLKLGFSMLDGMQTEEENLKLDRWEESNPAFLSHVQDVENVVEWIINTCPLANGPNGSKP